MMPWKHSWQRNRGRMMKQSEAIRNLRMFMLALQRYRGITAETLGPGSGELHLSEKMAAEMWPWVFGDKCPLPILSKVLDACDAGKELAPYNYYNLMVVLHRFMPEVKVAVSINNQEFPDEMPPISIMAGWEDE